MRCGHLLVVWLLGIGATVLACGGATPRPLERGVAGRGECEGDGGLPDDAEASVPVLSASQQVEALLRQPHPPEVQARGVRAIDGGDSALLAIAADEASALAPAAVELLGEFESPQSAVLLLRLAD